MARIAYFDIQSAIADQIRDDSDVAAFGGVQVVVEEATMPGREPMVFVFLTKREAPAVEQTISAGKRTVMDLYFSIWCYVYGYSVKDAIEKRDDLLKLVEESIMKDRQFSRSDVGFCRIDGGEFDTAKNDGGFNSGAEIVLRVRASAII